MENIIVAPPQMNEQADTVDKDVGFGFQLSKAEDDNDAERETEEDDSFEDEDDSDLSDCFNSKMSSSK